MATDVRDLPVGEQDYADFKNDAEAQEYTGRIGSAFDRADAVATTGAAFDDHARQQQHASLVADAAAAARKAAGDAYDTATAAADKAAGEVEDYTQRIGALFDAGQPAAGGQPAGLAPEDKAHADRVAALFEHAAPTAGPSSQPDPRGYRALARQAAAANGVDPDVYERQIEAESGFNPQAVSGAGARGLAQLMPDTAKGLGVDPDDPAQNLAGGAVFLRQMLDRYGGDYAKALAAYNAGPAAVDKAGGVPDFAETKAYVQKILGGAVAGGKMPAGTVVAGDQFGMGLPYEEAVSFCGPTAAMAFANANGRYPTPDEAKQLAKEVGWNQQDGMGGVVREKALLDRMGVPSRLVTPDQGIDLGQVAQDAANGNPVIVSTDKHYYVATGYDPQTGKLLVGKTGTNRKGGAEWMSAQEIANLDGGINGVLFSSAPTGGMPSTAVGPGDTQGTDAGEPYTGAAEPTQDQGDQDQAVAPPIGLSSGVASRVTGTGAPLNPPDRPLDTSSVGGFLRSLVPGLAHVLGVGGVDQTDATAPSGAAADRARLAAGQRGPWITPGDVVAGVPAGVVDTGNAAAGLVRDRVEAANQDVEQQRALMGGLAQKINTGQPLTDEELNQGLDVGLNLGMNVAGTLEPTAHGPLGAGDVLGSAGRTAAEDEAAARTLSGQDIGQVPVDYALHAGATAAGGVAGYGSQPPQQPGESDADYARRIAQATAAGAAAGFGLGGLATPGGRRAMADLGRRAQEAGLVPGLSIKPIDPAERAAMPAVDKILSQWDKGAQPTGPGTLDRLEQARTFLVRKLTDRRVDLNQLQQDVQRLYGSLPEDMQVSELSRLNPTGAATLRVQNDVAPAIREAGADLPYVNTLLGARGNVDVAAETGRKAEQAFLEEAKPPELTDIGPPNAPMVRSGVSERARTQPEAGPLDPARAAAVRQEAEMRRLFSGGVDVVQSQQAIDEMQRTLGPDRFKKVSDLADRIAQVNRDLRQQLVDAGRITQDTADEWARAYPNYTPVQIVDYLAEQSGLPASGQGKSLGVRAPAIHALSEEGTERARLSPIASTINNVYTTESLAKQNATVNALRNWIDRVPEMAQRFQVVDGVYSGTRAENAVSGWRDGERFTVVTPFADMAKVLRQDPMQTIPGIGPVMQVFKELITARNPSFLVRNALMDFPVYLIRETARAGGMPTATARAIGRYAAAIPDAFSGLMSGQFTGPTTSRYLAQGGSMDAWAQHVRSPQDAERYVETLRRSGGIHLSSPGDIAHVTKSVLSGHAFKVVGERVELVPRVAAFRAGEEAGLSPAQAVVRGRNVTVDFAEGGTWAKTLNQAIPFLNPSIQGGANLARSIYGNPKGAAMTFALGLAAPTLALEAWNNRDEDRARAYADVPNYVKDRGWVVMLPGPGGKGVLTAQDEKGNPTPQYLALNLREFAPVVDATRAAGRTAFGAETRSWGDLLGGAAQQVIPTAGVGDLTPVGAKTAVELSVDKDFYRGTHIATQNADERASLLSKALADGYNAVAALAGKYPNLRPSQVEYAGRENLGVLAQAASGVSDIVTGKKAGSTNPQDIPVAGAFLRGNLGNATGQQLENAREGRLDPDVKRTLYDTGLIADVTAVPNDIHTVPLLRAEQADYQNRANGHINDALRQVLADPAFANLPADIKKRVVQNVVQGAKAAAAGETLARIGDAAVRSRLATAKKAG